MHSRIASRGAPLTLDASHHLSAGRCCQSRQTKLDPERIVDQIARAQHHKIVHYTCSTKGQTTPRGSPCDACAPITYTYPTYTFWYIIAWSTIKRKLSNNGHPTVITKYKQVYYQYMFGGTRHHQVLLAITCKYRCRLSTTDGSSQQASKTTRNSRDHKTEQDGTGRLRLILLYGKGQKN